MSEIILKTIQCKGCNSLYKAYGQHSGYCSRSCLYTHAPRREKQSMNKKKTGNENRYYLQNKDGK